MGVIITEKIEIEVQCCTDYPITLAWLNPIGAYDTYTFGFDHQHIETTAIDSDFSRFVEELSTAESWQEVLQKKNIPKINLGVENIPLTTCEALRTMLQSVRVQMLLNPDTWVTDGPQWQTIIVTPGSFTLYNIRDSRGNIKFTIQLQEELVQQQ